MSAINEHFHAANSAMSFRHQKFANVLVIGNVAIDDK